MAASRNCGSPKTAPLLPPNPMRGQLLVVDVPLALLKNRLYWAWLLYCWPKKRIATVEELAKMLFIASQ